MIKKPLTESESFLLQNFLCLKCRNRRANIRNIKFIGDAKTWLPFTGNNLILLTCTLCGFCEIYDPQVSDAENLPEVADTSPLPQE